MLDPITIGCDWDPIIKVTPTDGETAAHVTAYLTGATVEAELLDAAGQVVATAAAAVVDAAEQTVSLSLSDAETAGLAAGVYRWSARVSTVGGKTYPLILPRQRVQA